ncbi:MAG: signal peptidase I [Bacteroidota bacterium]|nr:signal peptidase I [Bacteroidota bacterium]
MKSPAHSTEPKSSQNNFITKVKAALKEFAIVFGAFLVLNSFVIASFQVPTGSMENEIMTGDFLLVNKFLYGGTTPRTIPFTDIKIPAFKLPAFWSVERGDVIVFMFPGMRDEVQPHQFAYYLKRCMALPGDTLQIINRVVYVNGNPAPIPRNMKFNSPYIRSSNQHDPRIFPYGAPFNEDNYGPIVIPKKGDVIQLTHENFFQWNTFIGRENHTVVINKGKFFIDGNEKTSYTVEKDYVFGMGDNRDNSLDSRFWGFIPMEAIVGAPLIVYMSWDPDISIFDLGRKLPTIRWERLGTLVN